MERAEPANEGRRSGEVPAVDEKERSELELYQRRTYTLILNVCDRGIPPVPRNRLRRQGLITDPAIFGYRKSTR